MVLVTEVIGGCFMWNSPAALLVQGRAHCLGNTKPELSKSAFSCLSFLYNHTITIQHPMSKFLSSKHYQLKRSPHLSLQLNSLFINECKAMPFLLCNWKSKQTIRSLLNHTRKSQETLARAAMQFTRHQVIPFKQVEGWWPETIRRGQRLRDTYSLVRQIQFSSPLQYENNSSEQFEK